MWLKTKEEFEKSDFPLLMALDTETTSLNPREAEMEGIGWGDGKKQYYVDWASCDFKEDFKKKLSEVFKTNTVIFHNAKFDIKILKSVLNIDYPEKIHDTMIMSYLLNENRGHGLKDLTKTLLRRKVVEYDDVAKTPNLFQTEEMIKDDMANYCCADVKNTFDLYTKFSPLIREEEISLCYEKIEIPLIKVLADMELRGVKINLELLQNLENKAEAILLEKESLIKELVGSQSMNVRSSKQLRDLIFDKLGVKPVIFTPGGEPSTDNESLKLLAKSNSAVKAILDFREFDKLNGTYLIGLKEKAEKGILYTDFLQHRTRSGRLASANPNLQNIPARSDEFNIRDAFIPRPGYKLIVADYSQIELRIVAHYSQEDSMMKTFREGGDIHQLTADMVGCTRKHAKAINFGLIYGLSAMSLAKDLEVSQEQAETYMNTFFSKYSKLKQYINSVQTRGLFDGYITTLSGRRRRFKVYRGMDRGDLESTKRKLINTRIQGGAADLMKIAMVRMSKALRKYDAYMLMQIHDEIVVEAKESQIAEISQVIKDSMEKAVSFSIPIPVELTVADCWKK
jgi:DNA polymerase-1